MKKFSTAIRLLALASLFVPLAGFGAPPDVKAGAKPVCEFAANAPDRHTVVRGDTLWGISGKFLANPWCWPQVWGMNREQFRSPHWIYPGQIVYFDRAAGLLRLGSPAGSAANATDGAASRDIKLSPKKHIQGLGREAIPSIPAGLIEPFLSQPLIIEEKELKDTPRIVASQEGRINIGKDDKAYVLGDLEGGTSFQAFRPGKPLKDPVTKEILGYEAVYLGTLKLLKDGSDKGEAHSMSVVTSKEEMTVGDRLLPVKPTPFLNYVPHPPANTIEARVVSIYGGVSNAGQNQVVSINRGDNESIDIGTVLQLYRTGRVIADTTDDKKPVKLPDEHYGTLFIFRVFNNISYGLVMQVKDGVQIGDVARSPE
jgi:hypothetical protein